MDLIIGGAYQGKLDYARKKYNLNDSDIADASNADSPFSARCVYHFEEYLKNLFDKDTTAISAPLSELPLRGDAIIIAEDFFCDIVPMDGGERAFREYCGRTLTALASRCDTVTRIFCGLPQRLK